MKYGFLSNVSEVNFSLPPSPNFIKSINQKVKNSSLNFYIGSSTWSDKDFKGHFYPQKTPQKNLLLDLA